ncbi:YALI0E14795p [Yarrowia lipolytica CLIB122]|jgi:protein phosphatase 2C family protein 2/3|uniref:protein-serine/threonine phosphatase n=2 Tax=Yarrowia lipolytica TaxID=4952 RepID=Q6C5V6_YARLI|nr:YALI0E14795p [Yarrowia lipolytica CLIB122]KAJ8056934.1 phosphatase 2C-domain-containing protein [Yarrowia lipolytica]CAG79549.1 YALI0E14795p [Yarrowia lipolytica CLIB122]|eukprot:XP_503956.1 YALI0E14795p [Yarrowia lipolytica CLIB122]
MQGWRVTMEDAHATVLELKDAKGQPEKKKVAFFGVYDGHGGDKVAIYTGDNLHHIVARQEAFAKGDYGQALKDGFLSTDRAILEDAALKHDSSGCTATTAIVSDGKVICANAGDSRTVLGVKGIAKPMSFDHKPQHEGERTRICAAGGFVEAGRVNGNLALSRAIGDFDFKRSPYFPPEEQIVTAYPDVIEHQLTADDEFLILACDGIWDCFLSQEVVEFVRRGIAEKQTLVDICENLIDNCLAPTSDLSGVGCDNMTVMVVALLQGKTEEEWYNMVAERVKNGEGPAASREAVERVAGEEREVTAQQLQQNAQAQQANSASLALQQLLSSGATITDENGMVVLKAENAAELLAKVGFAPEDVGQLVESGDLVEEDVEVGGDRITEEQ